MIVNIIKAVCGHPQKTNKTIILTRTARLNLCAFPLCLLSLLKDDYFVFLISDANLASYGISPETLAQVLMNDDKINTYAIFIANKQEADAMKQMMPAGRAHTVLDTREMPRLFRQIFATAVVP